MNLFVGNLAFSITEDELRSVFSQYGTVTEASLVTDRFSGETKGFGFVEMPNNSEADVAIKALNGSALGGRPVKVNQAQSRSRRSRTAGRRRY
ncbi:MAG: RNA-binding protein [Gammaproteobacteria bacterium]|nr:RNA-binding protein [Gammaproteobacteria bacterium]MCP5136264.1 RNA-binding protein [Gammaproteobacteria bacterium]